LIEKLLSYRVDECLIGQDVIPRWLRCGAS